MNNIMYKFLGCLTGALIVLGLSGNAAAFEETFNGCESAVASFTGSIGSQATCSDFNMGGCVVGAGETECRVPYDTGSYGCSFDVSASVGSSDGSTFQVIGGSTCQIRMAIAQGNQGANYCFNYYKGGTLSDTMVTKSNKDVSVSHKQLEICTDEEFAGGPNISLEKTVVRVVDASYDCGTAVDSLQVIAPSEVAYCYTVVNSGEGASTNFTIVDDNATPGDPSDDIVIWTPSVPGNSEIKLDSLADSGSSPVRVLLSVSGEFVSKAETSGEYGGGPCASCVDSDTATVNVVAACDGGTQTIANQSGTLVESSNDAGIALCAPEPDSTTGSTTESFAMLCDANCKLRPGCKADPAACDQPCMPSKNWTFIDDDNNGQCVPKEPSPGKLPLCQEVLGNLTNGACNTIRKPTWLRSNGNKTTWSINPTVICVGCDQGGGGDSTGTIYCILGSGDVPADCPQGAFIF